MKAKCLVFLPGNLFPCMYFVFPSQNKQNNNNNTR